MSPHQQQRQQKSPIDAIYAGLAGAAIGFLVGYALVGLLSAAIAIFGP